MASVVGTAAALLGAGALLGGMLFVPSLLADEGADGPPATDVVQAGSAPVALGPPTFESVFGVRVGWLPEGFEASYARASVSLVEDRVTVNRHFASEADPTGDTSYSFEVSRGDERDSDEFRDDLVGELEQTRAGMSAFYHFESTMVASQPALLVRIDPGPSTAAGGYLVRWNTDGDRLIRIAVGGQRELAEVMRVAQSLEIGPVPPAADDPYRTAAVLGDAVRSLYDPATTGAELADVLPLTAATGAASAGPEPVDPVTLRRPDMFAVEVWVGPEADTSARVEYTTPLAGEDDPSQSRVQLPDGTTVRLDSMMFGYTDGRWRVTMADLCQTVARICPPAWPGPIE